MSNLTLTKTRMAHGQWEGHLSGVTKGETPEIEVRLHDQKLDGHDLHEDIATGTWSLVVPIPVDSITDGIQIFTIFDATDDTPLATFHVIAGEPDKKDLRAEVELLRAELDMLKRPFAAIATKPGHRQRVDLRQLHPYLRLRVMSPCRSQAMPW